jgi:hypothetical protein
MARHGPRSSARQVDASCLRQLTPMNPEPPNHTACRRAHCSRIFGDTEDHETPEWIGEPDEHHEGAQEAHDLRW